jgi:hypothetical protein
MYGCHRCARLLAGWVVDSGLTLNHQGKNYCRFCYVQLRQEGKIPAHKDDKEFLVRVAREQRSPSSSRTVKAIRDGQWVTGQCPSCQAPVRFQLAPRRKMNYACTKCRAHLEISAGLIQWVRAAQFSMVNNIAYRLGIRPRQVESVLQFFFDELAGQLAEGRYVTFRDLGSLQARPSEKPNAVGVDFVPSQVLLQSIVDRRARLLAHSRKPPAK